MATIDGLIIMGGPMNVYEIEEFPWLHSEKSFIKSFLPTGKPVLGVCLGAQLIAEISGAKVFPHKGPEIGWFPVEFTPDARVRFPNLPASIPVLHWHGDTFELPSGAHRFAQNEWCTEQGFHLGERVLALQFHLEAGPKECIQMVERAGTDLSNGGSAVHSSDSIIDGSWRYSDGAETVLYSILDGLFKNPRRGAE